MINMDLINLSTIIQDLLLLLFIYIIIKAIALMIIARFLGPTRCEASWKGKVLYLIIEKIEF